MEENNTENTDNVPPMATILSCEKELEDIQDLLEGLSTDINQRINDKTSTINKRVVMKKKLSSSASLHDFLTCTNVEFESQTNRMSITDLDLTQMTLQAELKMLEGYLQQTHNTDEKEISLLKKKISMAQDRMYRCITKKGQVIAEYKTKEFIKRRSRQFLDDEEDAPAKPERFITRDSVIPTEMEDLTASQLEVLLRHNSIDIPTNSTKNALLMLIAEKLLPEEWNPPEIDSMEWKNGIDLKENTSKASTLPAQFQIYSTSPASPTSPVEQNYFSLNPSGFQDYMKYKAMNDDKLINWDPTDLLKELYGKITAGARKLKKTATVKSKKVNCMQGYLDKLPMNQTKIKPFKGWRKRFFQVARGKLFYYEDHKSETPFGSIDILGAEVELGENKTIQITSKLKFGENKTMQGNKLVLRCNLDSEVTDWSAALKTMASIVPIPDSLKREGSLKKKTEDAGVVIIDIGASTIRAGMSTDTLPVLAFPATFAVKLEESRGNRRFTESGLPDPHSCRCGFEAFYPSYRKDAKLVFPLKPTLRVDKHSIKVRYLPGFFEKVFHDLNLDASNKVVIISCPRYVSDKDKEYILEYMFNEMKIRAIYMQQQALLSLYSYSVTTGLIVDIGDHLDVMPVVEGEIIEKGATSLPYAGQQVTEYLGKLLAENGYRFFSDIESFVVRYVKEEVAEASADFQEDMTSSPKPVDINIERFHLPDDRKNIRVGNMKFRCVEGLFNPGLWGKDDIPLHDIVERSIKACDIDHRRELSKNIYLSGGSSAIKGLDERLEEELKLCLPENVPVKVTASEHRMNAAFKGAIVVSRLDNFKDLLITRDEWHANGAATLAKWSLKRT